MDTSLAELYRIALSETRRRGTRSATSPREIETSPFLVEYTIIRVNELQDEIWEVCLLNLNTRPEHCADVIERNHIREIFGPWSSLAGYIFKGHLPAATWRHLVEKCIDGQETMRAIVNRSPTSRWTEIV